MAIENDLRQKLLELIHDLLPEDEKQQLLDGISSDPEIARAYSEAMIEAELLARAARLEGERVELKRPKKVVRPKETVGRRLANWAVAVAVCLLLAFTLLGYAYHKSTSRDIAANHLRLLVNSPPYLAQGIENQFTIQTQTAAGGPLPAKVEVALYDKNDLQLLPTSMRVIETGSDGRFDFTIPARLDLPQRVRLEVLAYHPKSPARMIAPLAVREDRFVTQLATDKPWYKPGETVFFRSLTLSSFTLAGQNDLPIEFEVLDPGGAPVPNAKKQGVTERGVGNGQFAIGAGAAGGQYTVAVRSLDNPSAFAEIKKQFLVRRYRLPRLKKEIEFTRDSYTPGDEVIAAVAAERAEGGPAAGARLRIIATIDGQNVFLKNDTLGPAGTYQVKFTLPEEIATGDGQLAVIVDDGGTRETVAKTLPINLGKVDVEFFPEGGDLVPGLANRVYFSARDPKGEPVHIEGQIVDSKGKKIADVTTVHEGRGRFAFTPGTNETYTLEIKSPANVTSKPTLPAPKSEARVAISAGTGVFESGEAIAIEIHATKKQIPLAIIAHCRGVQVGQTTHVSWDPEDRVKAESRRVEIPLTATAEGVIRVTVYDYSGKTPKPIAERLVYRRPKRKLDIKLTDVSAGFSPGDAAEVSLLVTDEQGRPVAATLGVSVVDDALLAMSREGKRQKPFSMPTHFLLASEVEKPEDLEDANFLLSKDEGAAQQLDLLLGTQGWRRFAERSLKDLPAGGDEEQQQDREQLQALLVARGGGDVPPIVSDNLSAIQGAYEAELSVYQRERGAELKFIRRTAFVGCGLLIFAVLILWRPRFFARVKPALAKSPRWVYIVGAGAACLLLIALLLPAVQTARESSRWNVAYDAAMAPSAGAAREPSSEVRSHWDYEGAKGDAAADPASGAERDDPLDDAPDGEEEDEDRRREDVRGKNGDKDEGRAGKDRPNRRPVLGPPAEARAEPVIRISPRRDLAKNLDRLREDRLGDNREAASVGGGELADKEGKLRGGRDGRGRRQGRAHDYEYWALDIKDIGKLRHELKWALEKADDEKLVRLAKVLAKNIKRHRFPVRQYAHQHISGDPGVRSDFTETLFWNPIVIAGSDGVATIRFDLSDSVTTFRVKVDAHNVSRSGLGRIGAGGGEVVSRIPFSLEPKLPLEVNAGDRIDLPLAVNNDTNDSLAVHVDIEHGDLLALSGNVKRELRLAGGQRGREYFSLSVVGQKGKVELKFTGLAGQLSDAIAKKISVVPPGFPVGQSYAGRIAGDQEVTLTLPKTWVAGSMEVNLTAFPSTLATLEKGLEGIMREPSGCFEQASTSNYPNVLALQYMQEQNVANPKITKRAKGFLKNGYAKLIGYECKKKGYEWFGGDPGHEALTAYGLMEFRDMKQVWDVDPEMIQRTAAWLMDRRDGKGGFKRNKRALDSFGRAPEDVTNAYIVWALTEAGQQGIDTELEHVVDSGRKSDDPYVIAMAAASAANAGQKEAGRELMKKLASLQKEDGHLVGTQGSITRSGGISLKVETTAIAALAWLKDPAFSANANKAVDWIIDNRQGSGAFGSTQATILALKALVSHAKANRGTVSGGDLVVLRRPAKNENDEPGDETEPVEIVRVPFTAGRNEPIVIENLAEKLLPGDNELVLRLTGNNSMPYSMEVVYRTETPVSHPDCPVKLMTKLAAGEVKFGETVKLTAAVENKTDKGQPMTIAILGLPGGLKARPDQLDELIKKGTFDYYETRAREVICYWRALAPNKKIEVSLDLVAEIPGKYTAPASRAYLYYTAEQKHWVDPVAVEIARE